MLPGGCLLACLLGFPGSVPLLRYLPRYLPGSCPLTPVRAVAAAFPSLPAPTPARRACSLLAPFLALYVTLALENTVKRHDEGATELYTHLTLQRRTPPREPGKPVLVTLHRPTPGILRSMIPVRRVSAPDRVAADLARTRNLPISAAGFTLPTSYTRAVSHYLSRWS